MPCIPFFEAPKCPCGHPSLSLPRPLSRASGPATAPPTGQELCASPGSHPEHPTPSLPFPHVHDLTERHHESDPGICFGPFPGLCPVNSTTTAPPHKGTTSSRVHLLMQPPSRGHSHRYSRFLCCPLQSVHVQAPTPLRIKSPLIKVR